MSISAAVSTGEVIKPETIGNGDDSSSSCSEGGGSGGGGGGGGGGALIQSEKSPPAAAETQPKSSGSQKKRSPQPKESKPAVDPKKRTKSQPAKEPLEREDDYCFLCGDGGELLCCEACPRVFHSKCLPSDKTPDKTDEKLKVQGKKQKWSCPDCVCIPPKPPVRSSSAPRNTLPTS